MHGPAARAGAALVGGTLHSFSTLQGSRVGALHTRQKPLAIGPQCHFAGPAYSSPHSHLASLYQGHTAFACGLVHGCKARPFFQISSHMLPVFNHKARVQAMRAEFY